MDTAEIARLTEIARLKLIDQAKDNELQKLVEKAAQELKMPTALVSIVLSDAQHFLASYGLEGWLDETHGTPREWSFCAFAVRNKNDFVVGNTLEHPDVKNNPLVTRDGIRSYAGVPLTTDGGHVVGTLCVLGDTKRAFLPQDMERLRQLADVVMQRLEERAQSQSNDVNAP